MAENRYFVCFSCQTTISNVIIGRDLICFGIFHLSVEPNIAPTQFLKPLSKQFFIYCSSFRDFYYKFFSKNIFNSLNPQTENKIQSKLQKKRKCFHLLMILSSLTMKSYCTAKQCQITIWF